MVSIRRRKLLAQCSGGNSILAHGNTNNNFLESTKPSNDSDEPKEGITFGNGAGSSNAPGSSKGHLIHQFPEVKRRKRHRRKHIENQEPCIMRGVYFKNMKWQAAIKVDKKQIHLGTVGSQEEAARLYDRAAFMCGREPNFEISEEEKQELRKFKWDEFLAMTRSTITNKKSQRRTRPVQQRRNQDEDWEVERGLNGFSGSEDEILAP